MTYADILRPTTRWQAQVYDLVLIVTGSLLIALSAQLKVSLLPFSPVPITGQTLAILMFGALLGSKRGAMSMLVYLAEGYAGMPVFSGGSGGPAHLAGPTGGYLVGFVAAAFLTGSLAEQGWDRRAGTTILAMLAGNVVIYALGLPWLSRFVGIDQMLTLGLFPFIVGDLLKVIVAAMLLPIGWRLVRS